MRAELKLAILKTGEAQWKTAQKAGIPESVLSHIVTGARDPDPEIVKKLSELLGAPVRVLFPDLFQTAGAK